MATERIWDIQGFSGGESDDITRGPKDSFYSGENIDVRKNLSGMQLSSKLTDAGYTISGDIIYMENLERFGLTGIVVCTDTGKVYLDGTLKQTFATGTANWDRVIGIGSIYVSGTQYLYYVSKTTTGSGKIHRSTTDLGTFSVSYKSFTTASLTDNQCTTISNNGSMYFSINNSVIVLDTAETVTNYLDLPVNENIVGFTQFQNNFKIYTSTGTNGIQYMWNGLDSSEPDYRQVWYNQPVLGVVNNGAFDYAVLGFSESYSDLYLIQGTQKQVVRVNLEAATTSRLLNRYLSIREDIVYISGGRSGESTTYGIYTYGNYYPGTAKSLVQEYSSLNTSTFSFHCHSTSRSYFASSDNKVYYCSHTNPPEYLPASGYVVTQMYEGNIWEEKSLRKMKVGFKLRSGDSIVISARKDIGDAYTAIKTIDFATYGTKKSVTVTANEFSSVTSGNFFTIQLKIEITHTGSVLTGEQTNVKRVTLFMDVVNYQ